MDTTRAKPIPVIQDSTCCGTSVAPNLAPERATEIAERLKAMADTTRLRMLDLLAQQREPICVCDITAEFDQHQPTISHHLRILREAGLVDCEKRGVWAYYWATDTGKRALAIVTTL
ncbi:MAG TPA: metalloregulator ArsR/SmtB family transcription factor [Ktedonobacterales bacterium]|nr:metalloregulator ArsR/SmtB family transcription factor [Ktedonobacterales bacterium]